MTRKYSYFHVTPNQFDKLIKRFKVKKIDKNEKFRMWKLPIPDTNIFIMCDLREVKK